MTQDLNDTLILGDHRLDLRDVLETELLQLLYILPIFIQDKQIVRQIHTGLHSVLKDKFGDNFPYWFLLEAEEARQMLEAEWTILFGRSEQEALHSGSFEGVVKSGL